jgi:lysophospholipase L1-like esterase
MSATTTRAATLAALAALAASSASAAMTTMPASDPRVLWNGRSVALEGGARGLDWEGSGASIAASGATFIAATFAIAPGARPFKVASWEATEGFNPPQANVWVSGALATPGAGPNGTAALTVQLASASPSSPSATSLVTNFAINMSPQY